MTWRRLCALLVGLAFVFATTEPLGAHACPFHDGVVASMTRAGMHGGHHSPAPGHSHQCTCLGASCCTVAVTAPSSRLVSLPVIPVKVVRSIAVARANDAPPTSNDDVLLPPPVGPPASLPV